ncbi:hypothetical protein GCM10028895_33600 [Pontibacter rugosus]
MASCDTPSDLRPGEKVSTEYVEPGTRKTFNVTDAGTAETAGGAVQHGERHDPDQDVLNHDPGANSIQKGDSLRESAEYNQAEGVTNR